MNKRKSAVDVEFTRLPDAKHAKIGGDSGDTANYSELLNDIQFVDFDDEFTASEGSIDDQQRQQQQQQNGHGNLNGLASGDEVKQQQPDNFLDLSSWKRCTIDRCERDAIGDLIIFGYEDSGKSALEPKSGEDGSMTTTAKKSMQCRLQQFWAQCRIVAGDIVSIMAVWDVKQQSYCVTNADGLVVVRPDFLVSGNFIKAR